MKQRDSPRSQRAGWQPSTGCNLVRAVGERAARLAEECLRADAETLLMKGIRAAFAGGVRCNDHHGT
jgi:hypothetical protein